MERDMAFRNQIIMRHLGKHVHVVVDRPIGYRHGDIVYPVNYGYIPGVMAPDGEEQDAYILGIDEPICEFDGRVIGAIRRKNDCEDKLVVAPAEQVLHQGEIAEAVHFQEQFFDFTVDSLFRKSCGIIPFRRNGKEKEYLILLQKNNAWSFPKGHMEAGETEYQTALRELFEETGLNVTLAAEKCVEFVYDVPPFSTKQVVLFLGEVSGNVFLQKSEVVKYKWVNGTELKNYLHPETFAVCKELIERKNSST